MLPDNTAPLSDGQPSPQEAANAELDTLRERREQLEAVPLEHFAKTNTEYLSVMHGIAALLITASHTSHAETLEPILQEFAQESDLNKLIEIAQRASAATNSWNGYALGLLGSKFTDLCNKELVVPLTAWRDKKSQATEVLAAFAEKTVKQIIPGAIERTKELAAQKEADYQKALSEIQALNKQLETTAQEATEQASIISGLHATISSLEAQLESQEEDLSEQSLAADKLRTELSRAKDRIAEISAGYLETIRSLEEQLKQQEQVLSATPLQQQKLTEAQQLSRQHLHALNSMQSRLNSLEQGLAGEKLASAKALSEASAKHERSQAALQAKLDELTTENGTLGALLDNLQEQSLGSDRTIQALNQKLAAVEKQLAESEEKRALAEQEMVNLKTSGKAYQSAQKDKLSKLKASYRAKSKDTATLSAQLEAAQKALAAEKSAHEKQLLDTTAEFIKKQRGLAKKVRIANDKLETLQKELGPKNQALSTQTGRLQDQILDLQKQLAEGKSTQALLESELQGARTALTSQRTKLDAFAAQQRMQAKVQQYADTNEYQNTPLNRY